MFPYNKSYLFFFLIASLFAGVSADAGNATGCTSDRVTLDADPCGYQRVMGDEFNTAPLVSYYRYTLGYTYEARAQAILFSIGAVAVVYILIRFRGSSLAQASDAEIVVAALGVLILFAWIIWMIIDVSLYNACKLNDINGVMTHPCYLRELRGWN